MATETLQLVAGAMEEGGQQLNDTQSQLESLEGVVTDLPLSACFELSCVF